MGRKWVRERVQPFLGIQRQRLRGSQISSLSLGRALKLDNSCFLERCVLLSPLDRAIPSVRPLMGWAILPSVSHKRERRSGTMFLILAEQYSDERLPAMVWIHGGALSLS